MNPKINIYVNNRYECSTNQSKTCKEAKAKYLEYELRYGITTKMITAHFDKLPTYKGGK